MNCSTNDNIYIFDDTMKELLNFCIEKQKNNSKNSSVFLFAKAKNLFVLYLHGEGRNIFTVAFSWFILDNFFVSSSVNLTNTNSSSLTSKASTTAPLLSTNNYECGQPGNFLSIKITF